MVQLSQIGVNFGFRQFLVSFCKKSHKNSSILQYSQNYALSKESVLLITENTQGPWYIRDLEQQSTLERMEDRFPRDKSDQLGITSLLQECFSLIKVTPYITRCMSIRA